MSAGNTIDYSQLQKSETSDFVGANSTNIPTWQMLGWEWAESGGSSAEDQGWDVTISSNGNIFITGTFRETISFGSCSVSSNTNGVQWVFVAKFDPNGTCLWAASAGNSGTFGHAGHLGTGISVDVGENVYVTGNFYNVIDFDNITIQASITCICAFAAKLDYNGTWLWATQITTSGHISGSENPANIEIDFNGNIFVSSNKQDGSGQGFISKISTDGVIQWTKYFGAKVNDVAIDSSGNLYIVGDIVSTLSISIGGVSQSFTPDSGRNALVAKLDNDGNWLWLTISENTTSNEVANSISMSQNGDIFVAGYFYSTWSVSSTSTLSTGGTQNGFVAKLSTTGEWLWAKQVDCSCSTNAVAITVDLNGNPYVTGDYNSGPVSFDNIVLGPAGGGLDVFVYKLDTNGSAQWALAGGSQGSDRGNGLTIDSIGNLYVTGEYNNLVNFGSFSIPNRGHYDTFLTKLSVDYDGDTIPDIIDEDDDDDYILDLYDSCQYSASGFFSVRQFDHDSDGCRDSDEDDDDDNDAVLDVNDSCASGMTGWISDSVTDIDSDGCMDALEDLDDDADGVDDYLDLCPREAGNSTYEFETGCPDGDGDGRPDIRDPFPLDSTEWNDLDGDGIGDNADVYPTDATQQTDSDGDGYGDNPYGNVGDGCLNIPGNSTTDVFGCVDSDGDGWSDEGEPFDSDPTQWADRDGDGYGDNETGLNPDSFPSDGTQWEDNDGDGYGDNPYGIEGDWFPNDPTRWADSDRDGYADEDDDFVNDASQWNDTDGDGYGDESVGFQPDAFPNDASEWLDSDGDGLGNNADSFPFDPTQQVDEDGDGYGDSLTGRLPDLFPNDATQWLDQDGDGLGDNQSGNNPDPSLFDYDNDGYNDNIDILPKLASPGDHDNDGCLDGDDIFPLDYKECHDFDEDGVGDNADTDDDNDGWTDIDEIREGTNPKDPGEKPVSSFEVLIPGTGIGLGAWDLIGIFAGVPLFIWLSFGFITRNTRAASFERELNAARSKEELEEIAVRSEYALMLRLIGAHQGIRLERLRAELDDALDAGKLPITDDHTLIVEQEMASDALPSGSEKEIAEPAWDSLFDEGTPDAELEH